MNCEVWCAGRALCPLPELGHLLNAATNHTPACAARFVLPNAVRNMIQPLYDTERVRCTWVHPHRVYSVHDAQWSSAYNSLHESNISEQLSNLHHPQ